MMESFPAKGRVAGIDFGTVRIGIAISDPNRTLASPFENYNRRDLAGDGRYFRQLAVEEDVDGFVVGLPVHASGAESKKSLEAREFGKWLGETTGLPVCFFDERYSTVQAEQHLLGANLTKKRRKQRLDMLAAQIMLAAFLESTHRDKPGALDG